MNPLALVTIIGICSFINGVLLFACPAWFNPFFGVMVNVSIPFFSAMAVSYYHETKELPYE